MNLFKVNNLVELKKHKKLIFFYVLFKKSYNRYNMDLLKKEQYDVYLECLKKGSGGMSLCLGFGKTLLSLVVALEQTKNLQHSKILVVVSKTLIQSWVFEIKKFFGDSLKYVVFHKEQISNLDEFVFTDEKIILTTPDVLVKFYKFDNIQDSFIKEIFINPGIVLSYNKPVEPFGVLSELYRTKFGCMIVDEVQVYTKISTLRCKSMSSICSQYRWVTSGTLFDEPSVERIFGYHMILDYPKFPRTLPDAETLIKSELFRGINQTVISRTENKSFVKPQVNEYIIHNDITKDEQLVYMSMKETLTYINKKIKDLKCLQQTDENIAIIRRFSTYLLAMLTYLRQSVVCPLIPIANISIDITNFKNKSELSFILFDKIKQLNLTSFFENQESVKSSRIKSILKVVSKHQSENIVIFTCFRTCLDLIHCYLPSDRKVLTISSNMTSSVRADVIEEFKIGNNNILLLTYDIGSTGLNLQCSNTILLADFYWNDGKTQQSIGRVLRYGQMSKEVNIYYFTSNTGVEKAIFKKQDDKLVILDEIKKGKMKSKIKSLSVQEIIQFIEKEDNISSIQNINVKRNT